MRRAAICLALAAGVLGGCTATPAPPRGAATLRGLWITRWDYRTARDVDRCLDQAARLGASDVYFQVRGQADALYRSRLEPWSDLLGGADPGFDPLARAVERAHRRGLRLHAWVNVYPLWRGVTPPVAPAHPLAAHPEWLLHDETGLGQALNDHYVCANPTDPAVQDHIAAVLRDICTRYPIDGLHLDYVRFVSEHLEDGRIWPGDPASLARWRAAGPGADPATPAGAAAYRAWIRDEITRLVARVAREGRAARPGLEISAAVIRRPELARDTFLQDAAAWLAAGHVDRVLPMIYTRDAAAFANDLAAWTAAAPAGRVVPGIGLHQQDPPDLPLQLAACTDTAGWSLFALAALVEGCDPAQDRTLPARERRRQFRAILAAY